LIINRKKILSKKRNRAIIAMFINIFLLGYGFIIAGYFGSIIMNNDAYTISFNPNSSITQELQSVSLNTIAYSVIIYSDNEIPLTVLSGIRIYLQDSETQTTVPIVYERIITGIGEDYYSQIATIRPPKEGIYQFLVSISTEHDIQNPRIVLREGDVTQIFLYSYLGYLIIGLPIANYILFKQILVTKQNGNQRIDKELKIQSAKIKEFNRKYCPKCSADTNSDEKFCFNCGYNLRKRR
jgi:hypothetical protein